MCGIVGLYLKDEALKPQLGRLLSDMLVTMSDLLPLLDLATSECHSLELTSFASIGGEG